VARLWVEQLRPLMIVWLLLTLPVVCHHETAVVILTAMAAGHQHQHMMAEAGGEPRAPSAAHAHGARHAQPAAPHGGNHAHDLAAPAAPHAASQGHDSAVPTASKTVSQSHGSAVPTASGRLAATQPPPAAPLQWRAIQAIPAGQGLPAADGVVFSRPPALDLPAGQDADLAAAEPTAPDAQRRPPPAPPPRALLG
jgi:hypothetical protein